MSHFVNTNFVFSCYFSVLFSPRMPAISFHLAIVPSYLFIYHRSHIINVMQTVTGNVCVNSNKSATRTSLFPCYFSCQSSHFQYNHDIGAFWHLLLYMQAIFSHLTGSCDSHVQFFRWFPWLFSYLRTQKVNAKTLTFLFIF